MVTSALPELERGVERRSLAVAALLAIGAYAATATFEFVYDDVWLIRDNAQIHSLANWRAILTSSWWQDALYRPVTGLWLALDWELSGGRPWLFHVVNVGLHAGVTVLVFALARYAIGALGAAISATVFAVHPVHVEAVANVVGRAELLAAGFSIGAVLLYRWDGALADRGDRSWRRALASLGTLAALLLAVASKESAFAAPALFLFVDWLDARRSNRPFAEAASRHLVLWVGSVALCAEFLWIWLDVVGGLTVGADAPGLVGAGLGARLVVMAPVVLEYVRLLVVPIHLSADYSPDFLAVSDHFTVKGVAGLMTVAAAATAAIVLRSRAPGATFGLMWLGATLLLVSNLLVPSEVLLAERLLYLPSVGAVLALGQGGAWAVRRWRTPAVLAVALYVALGLARTVTRVPVWHSNDVFFPQLVEDAPGSFRSYWVAGGLAFQAGDDARGERLMRQAIRTYPLRAAVWSDLAAHLEQQGRWAEAATFFSAAYRIDSSRIEDAVRAATDYLRAGAVDSAGRVVRGAWNRSPRDPLLWLVRADVAMARRRPLEAMVWRRGVARRFPTAARYWALTGEAALAAGYCPEVRHSVEELRKLRAPESWVLELGRRAEAGGCVAD